MNKKIKLTLVTAIAVLVFGLVNLNFSNIKNNNVPSLRLANIEVLASALAEGGGHILDCYKTISSDGSGNLTHVTYCTDCEPHLARSWSNKYSCQK